MLIVAGPICSVCGNTTYALMKDFISPDKAKAKTYDELVEIVAKHDKPDPEKIVSTLM